MKKLVLLAVIILIPILVFAWQGAMNIGHNVYVASGTTFYVDTTCTDTNPASATVDGTAYDPATPACTGGSDSYFVTIADLNTAAATTVPGDTLSLRKGQIWREQLTVPESGTSGNPITYSSHGTGNDPVISGADIISGNWVGPDGNGEYTDDSVDTQPLVVIVDGTVWLEGTITSLGATEWAWNSAAGGTLWMGADPAALVVEAGARSHGILSYHDYWTASNITVSGANGSTGAGIMLSSTPTDITIDSCTITNNAGYGIRLNEVTAGTTISNSTIDSNGACGIGSPALDDHATLTINGNVISNNGWRTNLSNGLLSGINVSLLSGSIYENTISGNGSGHGVDTSYEHGIYLAQSTGAGLIYSNNILNNVNGDGIKATSSATIYKNLIVGGGNNGIAIDQNEDDNVIVTVHHNVIADNDGNGIVQQDSGIGTVGVIILNNTLYKNGSTVQQNIKISEDIDTVTIKNNLLFATDTRGTLSSVALTGTVDIDNNIHWRADGDPNIYYNGADRTWATWQGYGFDTNGVNSDPLLTNPGSDDFTLTSTSPAINAGANLGATYDDALDPASSWPDSVLTVDQDNYGSGWEIGAYAYVPTWIWYENGENTGATLLCEAWDDTGDITVQDTVVLSGAYSLLNNTDNYDFDAFAATADIYVAGELRMSDTTPVSEVALLIIEETGGTDLCEIRIEADGDIKVLVDDGSGTTIIGPTTIAVDTTHYFKVRAYRADGISDGCALWWSTDGSSWTSYGANYDGSFAANPTRIKLRGYSGMNTYYDEVRIDDVDITAVDENTSVCQ